MYAGIMYAARVAKNPAGIRLYVDRDNETGHTVYESLGMHQAHYNIYEVDFVLGRRVPARAASRVAVPYNALCKLEI
jgi:hypothetical protein